MERIWLEHYPEGVPHDVDVRAYASLGEVFDRSCARFADRPAFRSRGTTLTYAEIDRRARDFAAYLQHDCGLVKGDRLAIMLPNLLQYPIAIFGAFRAGLVVVNCNPLYTPRELAHQLVDSGAKAVLVLEGFARTVQEVLPQTRLEIVITTGVGDAFPPAQALITNLVVRRVKKMVPPYEIERARSFRHAMTRGRRLSLEPVPLTPDDVAFLQYTGGTTGVPKGAVLTHGNMVANLQQISAWIGPEFVEGTEIVVTPLPLYHVFALTANLLTFLKWGALDVLIADPRKISDLVAELKRVPFTAITGVNTLFAALLEHPGFHEIDFRSLKVAFGGGMPVQRSVAEAWRTTTGRSLIEGYGLTECSPLVAGNPLDATTHSGAVGMPFPSTEVSIRDDAGDELPLGEVGEVCVRGPQVTRGYWNRPDETAAVLTRDGWLRTGDLGRFDARGYLTLTDRKKDLIIVSGFKVYPSEVEEVVMAHPGVREVAAIGATDPRSGQVVKIVVVRRDPTLTVEALLAYCRTQLTGYKVPRIVELRDTPLPKTPVGKILRRAVRETQEGVAAIP